LVGVLFVDQSSSAFIDGASEPMTKERLLEILKAHPSATTLDQLPALLPEPFLMNFILKHGVKRKGERGHLIETKVSQSADPQAPRAILWDERSGFSLSFNGGNPDQKANQRLDLLSFNHQTKRFLLEQIDFPIADGKARVTTSDCATCHGPDHRPIFSMYPDWPSFYGSDNDELTGQSELQQKELSGFSEFRDHIAPNHPRYKPLFSDARVERTLGLKLYPSFPYRQSNVEKARDVSRAFAFRPNLRMGIVFNRLNAQSVSARIKQHKRYEVFAPYFLFNLLQCAWSEASASARDQWLARVEKAIGQKPHTLSGGLLDYRQMLALFDLQIKDVDIRYSYDHPGYDNRDATSKPMEVGYIGRYFNSYFDGSATSDELIAAALYRDMPSLKGLATVHGLTAKYAHFAERFKYDEPFFRQMDEWGEWIPIPYPAQLSAVHHREAFKAEFTRQYQQLCSALESQLGRN
jgi:hypothetical protein